MDSFIQSIEGPASMSAADWDKVFARLMTSVSKAADVELLKMEFASVPKEKLQLFGSWLVDTWFPQVPMCLLYVLACVENRFYCNFAGIDRG